MDNCCNDKKACVIVNCGGNGGGIPEAPDDGLQYGRQTVEGEMTWTPVETTNFPTSYSTEPQWTGRRWIDGRKIYEITLFCESLPNATVKKYSFPQIINPKDKWLVSGYFKGASSSISYPVPYNSFAVSGAYDVGSMNLTIESDAISGSENHQLCVKIKTDSNRQTQDAYLVINYTLDD